MQVWPAIDLRGGKCVRLRQGDYDQETVFDDDPVAVARRWVGEGADGLHLVDLDGARAGTLVNQSVIEAIASHVSVPIQLGGGVRDEQALTVLFGLGVRRVVIGTRAVQDPAWLRSMCQTFPGQIVLGIDARDGRVATHGWLSTSDLEATTFAQQFASEPLAGIVYTDIARDGMMAGPNLTAMRAMRAAVATPLIASGGVTTEDDVRQLAAIAMDGCIIGRSLYEGTLTLAHARRAAAAESTNPASTRN